MGEKYLTISQAAEMYNKKPHQIRYAIKTGIIKSFKPNWEIFIIADSIPEDWIIKDKED